MNTLKTTCSNCGEKVIIELPIREDRYLFCPQCKIYLNKLKIYGV